MLDPRHPTAPYLGLGPDPIASSGGQVSHPAIPAARPPVPPQVIEHAPGLWTVAGLAVSLDHVIDAPEGLIVIDSGGGDEHGERLRQLIRGVSDRPIAAVVYSHSHYCFGTRALLADERGPVTIWAHPDCAANVAKTVSAVGPAYHYRVLAQYGAQLPDEGVDGDPCATVRSRSGPLGYRAPTACFDTDGGWYQIAGERVQVFTSHSFDTADSLICWFPDRAALSHNHCTRNFPPCYSIASGGFRDPVPWLAGLDRMRALQPEHLLGVHGLPLSGRAAVQELLDDTRDALQFVYDQTVRGLNAGLDADAILDQLRLPAALEASPHLTQTYAEWAFGVRAVATGLLGWFGGDAVDLHPVPPLVEARHIVAGFGGVEAVQAAVRRAITEREWAWAAKLARHGLRVEPGDEVLRQALADALRAMGQASPAWTTRNMYLVQAREWEGRLDRRAAPPRLDPAAAALTPPGTFVRALGYRLDPVRLGDQRFSCQVSFSDAATSHRLVFRRGVAAYSQDADQTAPAADCSFQGPRGRWLDRVLDRCDWADLQGDPDCRLDGDWQAVWDCLAPWPPSFQVPADG